MKDVLQTATCLLLYFWLMLKKESCFSDVKFLFAINFTSEKASSGNIIQ
jgi:hypothetical protein